MYSTSNYLYCTCRDLVQSNTVLLLYKYFRRTGAVQVPKYCTVYWLVLVPQHGTCRCCLTSVILQVGRGCKIELWTGFQQHPVFGTSMINWLDVGSNGIEPGLHVSSFNVKPFSPKTMLNIATCSWATFPIKLLLQGLHLFLDFTSHLVHGWTSTYPLSCLLYHYILFSTIWMYCKLNWTSANKFF